MTRLLTLFAAIVLFSTTATAQVDILEKDHEISRKAKRGYLGAVEATATGFDMIYVLPSTPRKVKIETYHFDADGNQKGQDTDDWDVEKARTKWRWFNYRGETYTTTTLTASANALGELVFRKKEITAKYNWLAGRYVKKVKLLDKVKLRDEEGKKYGFFGGAYEVERDSSILVLAANYGGSKDEFLTTYDLILCNNNVQTKVLQSFKFPAGVKPLFAKPLVDDESGTVENDDLPRDYIIVMAPSVGMAKRYRADDPTAAHYLRISPDGAVAESIDIKLPSAGFRILDAYEKDGEVLLYGVATGKDGAFFDKTLGATVATTSASAEELAAGQSDKGGMFGSVRAAAGVLSGSDEMVSLTQEAVDAALDEKNYTHFALMKISGGAVAFSTLTEMDEVNKKAVAGPDMKKPLKFDGKKFYVSGLQIMKDGSYAVSVQDFKKIQQKSGGGNKLLGTMTGTSTAPVQNVSTRIFKGMYLLHFNPQGILQHNFTISLDQRSKRGFFNKSPMTADMFPASSYLYESSTGKVNWVMTIVKAIDQDQSVRFGFNTQTTTTSWEPLYSIEYGTLDLQAGTSTEFKTLGDDEKRKYYLYPNNYVLRSGDLLYFFSETTRGDKMLVSRMGL